MVPFESQDPLHLSTLITPGFSSKIDNTLESIISRGEKLPEYCNATMYSEDEVERHAWVLNMLHDHCMVLMGTQAAPCKKFHTIDPLTPCMKEVVSNLAEEYAWSRGWCHVAEGLTDIPTFPNCESEAMQLKKYYENDAVKEDIASGIRLIFMITAYTDSIQVMRLLSRIYSRRHRYIVVVDKSQSDFAADMRQRVLSLGKNVVVLTPYAVVYLASSATRILAQGMAWAIKEFKDWDYFISLTGTDYPLMSISDIESELSQRVVPMPSLMIWENKQLFTKAYRKVQTTLHGKKKLLALNALDMIREERLRQAYSRRRGNDQFGIPLTCEKQKLFMRYSSRKSTQV